jgi:hypothetical protein
MSTYPCADGFAAKCREERAILRERISVKCATPVGTRYDPVVDLKLEADIAELKSQIAEIEKILTEHDAHSKLARKVGTLGIASESADQR